MIDVLVLKVTQAMLKDKIENKIISVLHENKTSLTQANKNKISSPIDVQSMPS